MFDKVKVNLYGKDAECIILAKFAMECERYRNVKSRFLCFERTNLKLEKEIWDCYLIYIPWKHREKEITLIGSGLLLNKTILFKSATDIVNIDYFESKDVGGYSKKIYNYTGYNFIYKNSEFIANLYYGEVDNCLDILYKEIPEILKEEYDDEKIVESLFISAKYRKGSAYIEFQFNDNKSQKRNFKNMKYFKDDSLLIEANNIGHFLDIYSNFLEPCISPDKSNKFCYYGLNFYTKERTKEIYEGIKKENIFGSEKLLIWLYEAYTHHNGCYILGI